MTAVITGTDNLDILQYSKDKSLTFTDYGNATEVQFKKRKNTEGIQEQKFMGV